MLRSLSSGRPAVMAPVFASHRLRRLGLLLLTVSGLTLGGCSADLLRFDAPAFNFNDDVEGDVGPVASRGTGYVPTGASLADARRDAYEPPPATQPMRSERRVLNRVAWAESAPPRRQNADAVPLSTGALGGARAGSVTVERGDTLYQISRRYGVSVAALRDANNLTGNIIRPGQTLVLPRANAPAVRQARPAAPSRALSQPLTRRPVAQAAGGVVTLAPGDSLYAISRRTGISVGQLKALNGITDVRRLQPGMQLRLGGAPTWTATTGSRLPSSAVAEAQRPVSRTDFGQSGTIKSKPIRTVSIGRDMAPAASQSPASATQPRILNGAVTAPARLPEAESVSEKRAAGPVRFRWPAKGRIIAAFNNTGNGVRNDGINISLPIGTPIEAVEDGVVAYAGSELKGYGKLVLLRHDNGWVSAYAHASEVLVKRGDKVTKGQVIAKAGRSGGVTQPQLHFELRREAKPVDPLLHLAQM